MKIYREVPEPKPEPFMPITIVLENEKEADMMWLKLNTSARTSKEQPLNYRMFCCFDEVHTPITEKE